jgi:NAD(P)H-dependent flavin oxidoreductase YrpB (nitropropane dioxygenase family)
MIVTPLTQMFGLQPPIVLAPIGGVSGGHLAATVSNAGGLGISHSHWKPNVLGIKQPPAKAITIRR